jgi:hypothetical protein
MAKTCHRREVGASKKWAISGGTPLLGWLREIASHPQNTVNLAFTLAVAAMVERRRWMQ